MPNELHIKEEAYLKMFGWARAAHKLEGAECCWLLQLEEMTGGGLLLEDVILPDQEATGGHVEAKQSGDWLKGIKLDQAVKFKGWGHSHHNMGTFYSGTDDDTLSDKWNGESKHSNHYAVGLVVSFPWNLKAWIVYFSPIETTKIELPIKILRPEVKDPMEAIYEEQVKQRLKKKVWYQYQQTTMATNTEKGTATDHRVVSELPDIDDDVKDWAKGELSREDPEDLVWDHVTGLSVRQLKNQNMWDAEFYNDLQMEVDAINRKRASHHKPKEIEDKRTCLHQSYNAQGKIICFIEGKNFDCAKCSRALKTQPVQKSMAIEMSASQTQLPIPPTSTTSETSGKKEEIAQPSPVVPISSPKFPISNEAWCHMYTVEPDGICPISGNCKHCSHAVTRKSPILIDKPKANYCALHKEEPIAICPSLGRCLGCDHAATDENRKRFAKPASSPIVQEAGKSILNS